MVDSLHIINLSPQKKSVRVKTINEPKGVKAFSKKNINELY